MFFSVAASSAGSIAARLDDLLAEGDGKETERVRICYHIGIGLQSQIRSTLRAKTM